MRRPWKRPDEMLDLERRLRDERPNPSDELVRRVSDRTQARRSAVPRLRLGLAMSVSGLAIAAVVALGGLGSPIDSAKRIAQFDNAGGSSHKGKDKDKHHGKPAKDQYEEKVTICHRPPGNPSNGKTLRLPRSAAEAHLRNHPYDTRGPCPPPEQKVTICHRPPGNPSNGQTLTLPKSAADAHLRNHRYDSRGACKKGNGNGNGHGKDKDKGDDRKSSKKKR